MIVSRKMISDYKGLLYSKILNNYFWFSWVVPVILASDWLFIVIVHASCHCLSILVNIVSTILTAMKAPVSHDNYSHTDSDDDSYSDDNHDKN